MGFQYGFSGEFYEVWLKMCGAFYMTMPFCRVVPDGFTGFGGLYVADNANMQNPGHSYPVPAFARILSVAITVIYSFSLKKKRHR